MRITLQFLRGGIALAQAIPPIATHFRSEVSLSDVCHIRTLCLNRSTNLQMTFGRYNDTVSYCVRWGSLHGRPPGKEKMQNRTSKPKHATENCCCHLANKKSNYI